MNNLLKISLTVSALFLGMIAFSAEEGQLTAAAINPMASNTVLGLWKTIDDKSNEPRSIVEIFEKDEKIFGKIVKVYPRSGNQDNCTKCKDEFKDQPILGMQFMWDLKKISNTSTSFDDGKILDPENGTIYRAKLKLLNDGKKLEVRGYIGISLFGRSQEWIRSSAEDLK